MRRLPATVLLAATLAACGDATATPDATPDTATPDIATPDTATPDTATPDIATPDTVDPATLCGDVAPESPRLHADHRALRDDLGRAVRLRGVNAGGRAKVAPFMPFAFAPEEPGAPTFEVAVASYLDRVRAWGLNVLRLPFTWEAVEPTRGAYDEAFLQRLDAYVAAADARGLRVILDLHQDVFARPYCGDGFPLWALADPAIAPVADCSAWFAQYYQNAAMRHDFDRFWANEDGLMDAFEAMWTMVARRYRDVPAVIAFEVLNEPGWGTHDMDAFSRDVLTPFFTRMIAAIRAVAPDQLVLVEPTGVDGVLVATQLQRPVGDGLVFAPHYYDGIAQATKDLTMAQDPEGKLAGWRDVGVAWDVPVLLGEFGVDHALPGAEGFMRAHWDALDALGMSGTEWEYSVTGHDWNAEGMSVVDADGTERGTAAELVRAYPEAIAGDVVKWLFDRETRVGELELDADGTSWVAAPARLYPEGLVATVVAGAGCARWDAAGGHLVIGGHGRLRVTFGPR